MDCEIEQVTFCKFQPWSKDNIDNFFYAPGVEESVNEMMCDTDAKNMELFGKPNPTLIEAEEMLTQLLIKGAKEGREAALGDFPGPNSLNRRYLQEYILQTFPDSAISLQKKTDDHLTPLTKEQMLKAAIKQMQLQQELQSFETDNLKWLMANMPQALGGIHPAVLKGNGASRLASLKKEEDAAKKEQERLDKIPREELARMSEVEYDIHYKRREEVGKKLSTESILEYNNQTQEYENKGFKHPDSLSNQIEKIQGDREFILDAGADGRVTDLTDKVLSIETPSMHTSPSQQDIAAIDELNKKKTAIEAMRDKQIANRGKPYYESKPEAYIAIKRKEEKKQQGIKTQKALNDARTRMLEKEKIDKQVQNIGPALGDALGMTAPTDKIEEFDSPAAPQVAPQAPVHADPVTPPSVAPNTKFPQPPDWTGPVEGATPADTKADIRDVAPAPNTRAPKQQELVFDPENFKPARPRYTELEPAQRKMLEERGQLSAWLRDDVEFKHDKLTKSWTLHKTPRNTAGGITIDTAPSMQAPALTGKVSPNVSALEKMKKEGLSIDEVIKKNRQNQAWQWSDKEKAQGYKDTIITDRMVRDYMGETEGVRIGTSQVQEQAEALASKTQSSRDDRAFKEVMRGGIGG